MATVKDSETRLTCSEAALSAFNIRFVEGDED